MRLAGILGVAVSQVSVKGKTNEKMDDVARSGQGEAYACAAAGSLTAKVVPSPSLDLQDISPR